MIRHPWALVLGLLLAPGLSAAADKAPAGTWKVSLPFQGSDPLWLLKFESKDGAWTGKVAATADEVPRTELSELSVKDGTIKFTLKFGENRLSFEGAVPADDKGDKIMGTVTLRANLTPCQLERTQMTSLDSFEMNKAVVATSTDNIAVLKAVRSLIGKAGFMKAKPEDVRGWMDKAIDSAKPYGPRWQRETLLGLTEMLLEQDGMGQTAIPYARRAERMMTDKDRPDVQKRTLELLANALERGGKADEAKEVTEKIKKLDFGVRVTAVPPRTGKANKVAVMELFTGAECPPCVAADLAFDALTKTFKPSEVVLIQYHMHIPGPDPLTNADAEARFKYYQEAFGRAIGGTPATLFGGTPGAGGGGRKENAQDKYDQYMDVIRPILEKTAEVNLKLSAARKDGKFEVTADVSDLKDAGASIRLRLLVVEEEVEYKGGNGLEKHHHVVRAMPGGAEGVALKDKALKHTVTVDVADMKKALVKYVEDYNKKNADDPLPLAKDQKDWPMKLQKLKVIALVQDDNTREILQAAQVDLAEEK